MQLDKPGLCAQQSAEQSSDALTATSSKANRRREEAKDGGSDMDLDVASVTEAV